MGQSQFIPVINQLILLSYACTPLYSQECLLVWIVSDLQSLWKDSCIIIISSFLNSRNIPKSLLLGPHHLLLATIFFWGKGFLSILLKISQHNTAFFHCGSAGKESACNAGDLGLILGLGRSPGEGKGLQYSGLENSMDCIVHRVTRLSDFQFFFFAKHNSILLI